MKKSPLIPEEYHRSVISLMASHFAFFKNAFMNNEHFINWLSKPENIEHKTVMEQLGSLMTQQLDSNEKLDQLLDSLNNKHAFETYFITQPTLLQSIGPVIVQVLRIAEKWESEQRVRTNIPQIQNLAITSSQYLPKALENLLKLKKLFHKASEVDFDHFVSLFFYENMPKRLPDDPNNRDVILHNYHVDKMNADLRGIYDLLQQHSGKTESAFTAFANSYIQPVLVQRQDEKAKDFSQRQYAFPKYLNSIEKMIKTAGKFGSEIQDELKKIAREKKDALIERDTRLKDPSANKADINGMYDIKLLEIEVRESQLREKMRDVDKLLEYSLTMVGRQDYFTMHKKKPDLFFKSLNSRQDYLDVMELQSSFGRRAAGMSLHENLFLLRLDLLKKLGVLNLPKSLNDINDYIKVNEAYSAHVKQSSCHINELRLLQSLLKNETFRANFTPEVLRIFQQSLDTLPKSDRGDIIEIDINNVNHVEALNSAYATVSPLCMIQHYPLIADVHTMSDSLSDQEFARLSLYLYQEGKEIIHDTYQVDNAEKLLQVHQAFNALKNSDEIRPLFLEHRKHIDLIQRLIKDETFQSYLSPEAVSQIQVILHALPKSKDGTSVEIDIHNAGHVRALLTLYSLCKIDHYPLIDDVRLLRDHLSEEQFSEFASYHLYSNDTEIIHDTFQANNLVNLYRVHHLYDLLSHSKDIKPILNQLLAEAHSQKDVQPEVDFSPKELQQEKSKPIQSYTALAKTVSEQQKLQAQQKDLHSDKGEDDADRQVKKN